MLQLRRLSIYPMFEFGLLKCVRYTLLLCLCSRSVLCLQWLPIFTHQDTYISSTYSYLKVYFA